MKNISEQDNNFSANSLTSLSNIGGKAQERLKKRLAGKKVSILHANIIEKDFRLKKTVTFLADAGAEVTVIAFPWNKVEDPHSWPCRFVYSEYRTYPVKASENHIWALRVLWNKLFLWPSRYFDLLLDPGYGLAKEAVKQGADIYYLVNVETAPEGIKLLKKTNKPLVYDAYEFFPELLRKKLYFNSRRKNTRFLNYEKELVNQENVTTIVVNEIIAREYKNNYGCKIPEVIFNVAPEIAPELTRHDEITFYYQSRLRPMYNLEGLIDAFSLTRGKAKLVIQGEFVNSEYQEKIIERIKCSHRRGDISVVGPCSYEDVVSVSSQYDVGVDPLFVGINGQNNLNFQYALPNKFFTYLSAGLCLASSKGRLQSKIVEENALGVTFDPSNISDFADKLQLLIDNPQRVFQMREAAHKYASRFSLHNESCKLQLILSRAVQNREDAYKQSGK